MKRGSLYGVPGCGLRYTPPASQSQREEIFRLGGNPPKDLAEAHARAAIRALKYRRMVRRAA